MPTAKEPATAGQLETKYGLPREVKFCARCVISNQRPNSAVEYAHTDKSKKTTINFDAEGVCDACRFAETKRTRIDWSERERQLRDLCDQFRRDDGGYDCLVPGSGGEESFLPAHPLKYKERMHTLHPTSGPPTLTASG